MRCLSLWQPWAQLVVLGMKRWETRSWSTTHRGPLAIHAAKQRPPRPGAGEPGAAQLQALYNALFLVHSLRPEHLARGCIVGAVVLDEVVRTEHLLERETLGDLEAAAGNFAPGRFAWRMARPAALERPIPQRGFQGLFDVPLQLELGPGGRLVVDLPGWPPTP